MEKDYFLLDEKVYISMRQFWRASYITRCVRARNKRGQDIYHSYLTKRMHAPREESRITIVAAKAVLQRFIPPGALTHVFYKSRLLHVQMKREAGVDARAMRFGGDAFQMLPAVAKTPQQARRLLCKVEEFRRSPFWNGHCWEEFLSQGAAKF
ncbi:hypothetical protein DOTSEDRAFT_25806 [Dothistroma septosporum NZE10]|uniref:Uncharacterized protein n=1 Tax=Dothistroma septosporum (strain NZE10 / CBS 128990) TaxID=675120 RepID=N1PLI9_DOTSN|nr:hypothetical protein DOTSEDRAFT_25806 [Dothistroma septosporum NZE10]